MKYSSNVRLVNQFVPNRKVSINLKKKLAKIINGTTFIASQYELSGIISSLKRSAKTITDNNINEEMKVFCYHRVSLRCILSSEWLKRMVQF
jgi:regulatory protein YycH of two-component signal transduction system YycFG